MALSSEQITAIIQQAVQVGIQQGLAAAMQGTSAQRSGTPEQNGGAKKKDERTFDEKTFKRMTTFNGTEKDWKEWAFKFTVTAKTVSTDLLAAMEEAEKSIEDVTTTQIGLKDEFLNKDIEKESNENPRSVTLARSTALGAP